MAKLCRSSGLFAVLAGWFAPGMIADGKEPVDWRIELLAKEGVSSETRDLEKFQQRYKASPARLNDAVARLGDDQFAIREQAQREILLMGRDVLPWIQAMPASDSAEIRLRLREIRKQLTADGTWQREDLLRDAVNSLLRERQGAGNGDTSGILFAEFFEHGMDPLPDPYRRFRFKAEQGMKGLVSEGVLRLRGSHDGDGDQSLLLQSEELGCGKVFPETFRVEVRMGGEAGGEGVYHVGVSIGNVKALLHPGYRGGGFRFEKADDRTSLTSNTSMGFSPSTKAMQRMMIDVKRNNAGDATLEVVVTNEGKTFRTRGVFKKDVIGSLSTIGLVRSGRSGGDAVFDDLVVGHGVP